MGKALIAVCVLAGCQMYKSTSPKLKNPEPVAHKEVAAPVAEVPYVEACTVDFSAQPVKRRQTTAAAQLVVTADTSLDTAARAKDDQAKVGIVKSSIQTYSEALIKDPYNAEATLKLALAYDRVLRKGCALAMLKRLSKLASNPAFQADARIDRVVDNEQWFKGYREAALRAIGH